MKGARQDGLRRREALLDAALRCFVEQGLVSTGIEDIRKAAGASPSSVYHLFGGLPGVISALQARTFERLFEHVTARVLATSTAEAAIREMVDAHLEWVIDHRDEAHFMYQATSLELGADEAPTELKAKLRGPMLEHLGPFFESGDLPRWSPLTLDLVLLGPTHEACRRYLAGADIDPEWMRATLPGLAWKSITS